MSKQSFQEVLLGLGQSLIGAISDNFRMITIEELTSGYEVVFYLWRDDAEDREEIDDLLGDFAGYLDSRITVLRTLVVITSEYLITPGPGGPVAVFKKRQLS